MFMDPQKNAPSPAPYNPGQQPQTPQDDGFQSTSMENEQSVPAQPATGQPAEEVTVDFHDTQNAEQPATQPTDAFTGAGGMPSITSEAAAPTPVDGQVSEGTQPSEVAPNPAVPGQPAAPAQDAFTPAPGQPATQAPAGQPDPQAHQAAFMDPTQDQQPAVPGTVPTTGIKADKKTVIILAVVAVVLIAAIAVLIFM
jgi:hypothetical protein